MAKPIFNTQMRALVCAIGAILWVSCSSSEDSAAKGARIIADAKRAMGGDAWNSIRIWYEEGQFNDSSGPMSTYEHWGDLQTLSLRNSSSSRQGYMIFDGNAAFTCGDAACSSHTAIDARAVKTGAYMTSYGFFFPERFPAALEYLGVRSDRGVEYDVVEVIPDGLYRIEVWVERRTRLVSRLASSASSTELSGFRQVGAITVPFVTKEAGTTITTRLVRFDPEATISFGLPIDVSRQQ